MPRCARCYRLGYPCSRQRKGLLVVRMKLDRQPLLSGVVVDAAPGRDETVPHGDGQLLDGAEDRFLAWRQLDPVHAASLGVGLGRRLTMPISCSGAVHVSA